MLMIMDHKRTLLNEQVAFIKLKQVIYVGTVWKIQASLTQKNKRNVGPQLYATLKCGPSFCSDGLTHVKFKSR